MYTSVRLLIEVLTAIASFSLSSSLQSFTSLPSGVPLSQRHGKRRGPKVPKCARDWESFPAVPVLKGTVFVQPQEDKLSNHSYPSGKDQKMAGLFVHPPSKFAFCWISKNGSKEWSKVLAKLYWNDLGAGEDKTWRVSKEWTEEFPDGMRDVFEDPTATRAVFVRDPLKRFVSAYIDKCVEQGENCPPLGHPPFKAAAITFKDTIDWFVETKEMNTHWQEQSHFCELQDRIRQYTVIGLMEKDTNAREASCLMEVAGISEFNRAGPSTNKPFWTETTNYTTKTTIEEEQILQKLFTRAAAEKLMERYRDDYDLFHFDRNPSWLAGATGEWYEVLPENRSLPGVALLQSGASENRNSELNAFETEEDDEDDIVPRVLRHYGHLLDR